MSQQKSQLNVGPSTLCSVFQGSRGKARNSLWLDDFRSRGYGRRSSARPADCRRYIGRLSVARSQRGGFSSCVLRSDLRGDAGRGAPGFACSSASLTAEQLDWKQRGLDIQTKLAPRPATDTLPEIRHTPDSIRTNLEAQLKALKTTSLSLYYLHVPDHTGELAPLFYASPCSCLAVPYEDTLLELDRLHREGKFKRVRILHCYPLAR